MKVIKTTAVPEHLIVVLTLAQLLERLEHSRVAVDAAQYQLVATRLSKALGDTPPGVELQALLNAHPAAAFLYENLHYAHAGLLRSPLALSLSTEASAREVIQRAAHTAAQQPPAA
jgi:hypothetical protein